MSETDTPAPPAEQTSPTQIFNRERIFWSIAVPAGMAIGTLMLGYFLKDRYEVQEIEARINQSVAELGLVELRRELLESQRQAKDYETHIKSVEARFALEIRQRSLELQAAEATSTKTAAELASLQAQLRSVELKTAEIQKDLEIKRDKIETAAKVAGFITNVRPNVDVSCIGEFTDAFPGSIHSPARYEITCELRNDGSYLVQIEPEISLPIYDKTTSVLKESMPSGVFPPGARGKGSVRLLFTPELADGRPTAYVVRVKFKMQTKEDIVLTLKGPIESQAERDMLDQNSMVNYNVRQFPFQ